ncbi:2-phosphosulfolactate phosphatase [Nocardioides sp. Soil797]|nr:2-phosphosulfolactate phosphatase [Nocardioides sp. Soil797]
MNTHSDAFDQAHRQTTYDVRFEWGPVGAEALGGCDHAVVVDVLSFTTSVTVAVERGIEVFPFRWRDARAKELAMREGATLAVGRFEALGLEGRHVSLSPSSLQRATDLTKLVLPSPNGSTICDAIAESGAEVIAASLRNRRAVAAHLAREAWSRGRTSTVAVVAAGERWPGDTLRPCVEDLWGAGAVLAALVDLGLSTLSPEARVAEQAFRAVEADLREALHACASGRELVDKGFEDDVAVAAEIDASTTVPVLAGGSFTDHA